MSPKAKNAHAAAEKDEHEDVPPVAGADEADQQQHKKIKKIRASKVPALPRLDFSYTFCYCEENVYKFLERMTLMQVVDKAKFEKDPTAAQSIASQFDRMYAVFFSSFTKERKCEKVNGWASVVPLRVSSGGKDDLVCTLGRKDCCVTWDYHAVALLRSSAAKNLWFVADFDTRFPTKPDAGHLLIPAEEYFSKAFNFMDLIGSSSKSTRMNPKKLQQALESVSSRIVPSESFLTYFRSDRSHMKDKKGGYQEPPPDHPLIDGPSPIVRKVNPSLPATVEPYNVHLTSNIVSYLNMADQSADPSLKQYLGEVVKLGDLRTWMETKE